MKMVDIRSLSNEKILSEIEQRKKEQYNLRFQMAMGEQSNPSRFGIIRKEIARFMTELSARRKK